MDNSGPATLTTRRNPRKLALRLLLRLLIRVFLPIAVGLPLLLAGVVWWQDRPLKDAEQALDQGRPNQALTIIDDYLRQHPGHDRALAIRARTLVALGRWSEADRLFDRIGAASAEDLHAWATALLHRQQWAHALPLLERVLQIEPDHADALHEVTACRANLGDMEGALRTASRLAGIRGFEAAGYLQLATLHERTGNYQSAVEAWERLLEHRPDASGLAVPPQEILLACASSLHNVSRSADALTVVERSLALEATAPAHVLHGQIQLSLGDEDAAVESWKRAVQIEPRNLAARRALAQAAIQNNAPQAAIDWLLPVASSSEATSAVTFLLQRAYTILPDEARAAEWRQRTESLRRQEQLQATINQSLRERPLSFWSQVIYAHRFASEGNWGQAEVLMDALIQQAPEQPFVRDLYEAVQRRGALPPLDSLATQQF